MAETQWDYIPSNGRHWVERHAMSLGLDHYKVPSLAVSAKGHQIACDFLKAALQSATKQRRLAAGLRGVE